MKIYTYKPVPNIALGYSQDRIVQYLKEHSEAAGSELYKLSSKQSKPLEQLKEKGIVIETDGGKYRLRKTVQCDRLRYERLFLNHLELHGYESAMQDKKLKEIISDYYDIEEVSTKVREALRTVGYFLDIDDNESDILIFDGKSKSQISCPLDSSSCDEIFKLVSSRLGLYEHPKKD